MFYKNIFERKEGSLDSVALTNKNMNLKCEEILMRKEKMELCSGMKNGFGKVIDKCTFLFDIWEDNTLNVL